MHIVVWEFHVREGGEAEFERLYGPEGDWVRLFRKGKGFLQTELLKDSAAPSRYLTVDRWTSQPEYEAFRRSHAEQFRAIDQRGELLTTRETTLGAFLLNADS